MNKEVIIPMNREEKVIIGGKEYICRIREMKGMLLDIEENKKSNKIGG